MDWIDPRHAKKLQRSTKKQQKSPSSKQNQLNNQLRAALASPISIWGTAFGHALDQIKWPGGLTPLSTFAWSCTSAEQVDILSSAGLGAKLIEGLFDSGVSNDLPTADVPAIEGAMKEGGSCSPALSSVEPTLQETADGWLDDMSCQPEAALGAIVVAWQVPELSARTGNNWIGRWLQDAVERIQSTKPSEEDAAMCHLAVRCELPLLLSVMIGASRKRIMLIAQEAMDDLALLLEQGGENPACWLAYGTGYLRASLASVLRCRFLANRLGMRAWFPPQKKGLAALIQHAVMWTRQDGSALLTDRSRAKRSKVVWNALLAQTRKPQSLVKSMSLSGLGTKQIEPSRARKKLSHRELAQLSHHNEEARCACMLSDWLHRAGRVAVDYSDVTARIELVGMKGKTLLSGDWTAQVEHNGQSQLQLDDWERVCWFSDEDVDYLELEAKFGQACCVQRQLMLFREERMVVVADALLGDQEGKWTLTSSIPIAADIELQRSDKNTEVFLASSPRDRALVMPLAIPEWRRESSPFQLGVSDDKLVMRSDSAVPRMYVPIVICLNGKHASKPLTWRRLTVGENMTIVAPDVASAFRAQIGKEQWLLYRTLTKPTRRTAMGMHTGADFLAVRFCAESGEFETLVEVVAETP